MEDILIVDGGGTNFRVALSTQDGITNIINYQCADYAGPSEAIDAYCLKTGITKPKKAVLGLAGPIKGNMFRFTNGAWSGGDIDFSTIFEEPVLINDFAALAYALLELKPADCTPIIAKPDAFFPNEFLKSVAIATPTTRIGFSNPKERIGIFGPGTGLGVGGALFLNGQYVVEDCEGGHITLPVKTDREFLIYDALGKATGKEVALETVCSGPGLVNVFNVLSGNTSPITPKEVQNLAHEGDADAREAVDLLVRAMGRCAGAMVLERGIRGNLFIAGGITKKLGDLFDRAVFTEEFLANDFPPDNNFVNHVPVYAIDHPHPGLLGAHAFAQHTL